MELLGLINLLLSRPLRSKAQLSEIAMSPSLLLKENSANGLNATRLLHQPLEAHGFPAMTRGRGKIRSQHDKVVIRV